jgi:hypothetical protein
MTALRLQPGMTVGFWFDYDQTWTFTALYQELARRVPGLQVCGYVINDRYLAHAREHLPAGSRIEAFYQHYNAGLATTPSAEALARFEPIDRARALSRIAYSDRHLQKFGHDQIVAVNVHLWDVFNRFLDETKPDVFVFNCVASQFAHLMYEALIARGIRVAMPFGFGVEDLIYWADNPFLDTPDLWARYRAFRDGQATPTAADLDSADAFIARIRSQRPAYDNKAVEVERARQRLPSPTRVVRYLVNAHRHYRTDPTLPSARERVLEQWRIRRNRPRFAKLVMPYERLAERPFIYFPLHYEPEVSTLVIAPLDQASVIDMVARRMPVGWRLVLKDHPAMVGQRDPAFFERLLRQYPNVVTVDPAVPTLELVQRAELTFTIAGTTAIEAAVLGRPVLQVSQSRFGSFGPIPRATDILTFDHALSDALAHPPAIADVRLMLAAIYEGCDRFVFGEPLGVPETLSADNIARVADTLIAHLARPSPSRP